MTTVLRGVAAPVCYDAVCLFKVGLVSSMLVFLGHSVIVEKWAVSGRIDSNLSCPLHHVHVLTTASLRWPSISLKLSCITLSPLV